MIKHFLACFLKNTSPANVYMTPIPTRDYPVEDVIPSNAYAYYICDVEVIEEDGFILPLSTPENCSPKTYLGGIIFEMEIAKEMYADDKEMLEFLSSWDAQYIIAYNDAFFPFYDEDIHISVKQNL